MAEAADDPLLGRVIAGKFRIERALGAGAMGRVYLGQQINLDKRVAIKVLHASMAGDPALQKRFHREAKSASQLSHPHIVQMLDFGEEAGLLYIAMELLDGRDLGKLIRHEWPLAPERIGLIVGQILSALEEAHEKGIVHRDLKPENIMLLDVRGEDFVKVCDFGIAKAASERDGEGSAITMAGMVCGTPEYMSPEQARGEPIDGRSDLYAVACILYQLACAELPFRAETALGVVSKLLTEAPQPPSQRRPDAQVGAALEAVILRGLAKPRDQRFANAMVMREALFEAVGIKRSGSGQVRARAAGASEPEMALATTGVATPASQPVMPPGGSVHGEMAAQSAVARPRSWALPAVAASALVIALAVLGGRALLPPAPRPLPQPLPVPAALPPARPIAPAPQPIAPPPQPLAPQPKPIINKEEHHHHASKVVVAPVAAPPVEPEAPKEPHGFAAVFADAERLFKSGNVDGALARYLEAARLDPADARAQRQIGKCYNRQGQRDRAQPYLKRYLELSPNAADAAFIRAMIQ